MVGSFGSSSLLPRLEQIFRNDFWARGVTFPSFTLGVSGTVTSPNTGAVYSKVNFLWDKDYQTGLPPEIYESVNLWAVVPPPKAQLDSAGLIALVTNWQDHYFLDPNVNNAGSKDYRIQNPSGGFAIKDLNADTSLLATLGGLLSHIGSLLSTLGTLALDVIGNIARAALAALLRVVANVDIQAFFDWIDKFVGTIGTIVGGILRNPGGFARRIFHGIGQGFGSFFSDPSSVLQGLADWAFGTSQNSTTPSVPKQLDAGSLSAYLLALVGIDIAGLTQGASNAAAAADRAHEILDAIRAGQVDDVLTAFNDSVLPTERITPDIIRSNALGLVSTLVIGGLSRTIINVLVRFFGGFIGAIYNFVKLIFDGKFAQLAQQFGGIVSAFVGVLAGAATSVAVVRQAVVSALGTALRLLLGLLDLLPGVGEIKKLLQDWRQAVSTWLRGLWQRLTGWFTGFTYGQSSNPRVVVDLGPPQTGGKPRVFEIRINYGAWASWAQAKTRLAALGQYDTRVQMLQMSTLQKGDPQLVSSLNMLANDIANMVPATCGCGRILQSYSPSSLRTNLQNGNCGPKDPTVGNEYTISNQPLPHHIVPGLSMRPGTVAAQMKLANPPVCIGINDAVNGVFLPRNSAISTNIPNPKRTFHNCTRRQDYYELIETQFAATAANRTDLVALLASLRQKLINGERWPGLTFDPNVTRPNCQD